MHSWISHSQLQGTPQPCRCKRQLVRPAAPSAPRPVGRQALGMQARAQLALTP